MSQDPANKKGGSKPAPGNYGPSQPSSSDRDAKSLTGKCGPNR